jgi:SPP1 gp7 family putative phage head morphogenesis protein
MNPPILILQQKALCACLKFDLLDSALREYDALVSKAAGVSEVAQIARIEVRARTALSTKWSTRASQAARSAGAVYASTGNLKAACAAADLAMNQWAGDVASGYAQSLEDVYRLARRAGHNKATGKSTASLQYGLSESTTKAKPKESKQGINFSFNVKDERAIGRLQKQELWWIGDTYKNVAPTIREGVEPKVLQGLSRKLGGEMVRAAVESRLADFKIPDGYHGPASGYFEGLAANAVTSARVYGQLTSFGKLGVTSYELVNPMDARTSDICAELNGTVFQVADAEAQMTKLAGAKTPDQYKAIKPWVDSSKMASLIARGTGALKSAGQMFPPFHFRCRTTCDISHESLSFSNLDP